jgi:hypothetical protein
MNDKKYLVIPTSELKKVNFDDIMQHSHETLSYSGDGKRTFIKWVGQEPSFVANIENREGPYNHEEIKQILRSTDWISPSKRKTVKKVT